MGASASAEMDGARYAAELMPLRSFLRCKKQALNPRRCGGMADDAELGSMRPRHLMNDIKPLGLGESQPSRRERRVSLQTTSVSTTRPNVASQPARLVAAFQADY